MRDLPHACARRRLFLRVLAAAGAGHSAAAARAADAPAPTWPTHPIRLLCPLGAGTSADALARLVARGLTDALGQNVIVDNRAGASGNIAAETVARAPADGHTLLIGSATLSILPATTGAGAVNPETALTPVSLLAAQPLIIVAHPSFGGSSFADIVRMARAAPGTIAYSTSGIGGIAHLAATWATSRADIRLLHVPYTANRALVDLMSGEVPLAVSFPGSVLPMVRAGQLKAIAITGPKRLDLLPEVPTLAESGLPGFEVMNWLGILAPTGMPAGIVQRLQDELARLLATVDFLERLRKLGFDPVGSTREQFAAVIRQDIRRWKSVVSTAGLRFE